ncbi:class I SAM-dependent methyltransferase [Marinimicrobium sp. C2-29]|uniref:class I SAM-dependent methyltransferase n=1 Tax=Marinimicrobium sp. C2-29 TaxID=3139825 RepID=UPI0031399BD7
MSGFSIDWLNLREDADRRARDQALRERALRWLAEESSSDQEPVVVDLGAGTGSTLRALSTQVPLSWRLVDNDKTLLTEAQRRHGRTQNVETCLADLADVETLPLDGVRLVTASALFDLVSANFIEALAKELKTRGRQNPVGLYTALNYDGTTHWTPAHPLDEVVLQAFNRDQRKDKGFGPALGPDAGSAIARVFSEAGFEVHSATSPWVLEGADQHMVSALITGIAGAVSDSPEIDSQALKDWVRFRHSNVQTGTCTVGHIDLLALPV